MAYRFNGSSDYLEFNIAPFTGYTFGPQTWAVFVKFAAVGGAAHGLTAFATSALANRLYTKMDSEQLALVGAFTAGGPQSISSTSLWYLLVITHPGVSGNSRFHVHNGTSWNHGSAGSWSDVALVAGDRLRFGTRSSSMFLNGDVVCVGVKKSNSTDLQVETLTRTAFTSWAAFGFDWLIGFDGSGTRSDLGAAGTGGEISRSGTSLVSDPAGWSFVLSVAPVADFTGTPLTGNAPLSVAFTDSSTNTPTSWAWNFGDGGTSTSQNPTHSYTVAGTYTVTLIATNAAGSNTKTRTSYVTVTETIVYVSGGGIDII